MQRPDNALQFFKKYLINHLYNLLITMMNKLRTIHVFISVKNAYSIIITKTNFEYYKRKIFPHVNIWNHLGQSRFKNLDYGLVTVHVKRLHVGDLHVHEPLG